MNPTAPVPPPPGSPTRAEPALGDHLAELPPDLQAAARGLHLEWIDATDPRAAGRTRGFWRATTPAGAAVEHPDLATVLGRFANPKA